jgi:hypothetical protein
MAPIPPSTATLNLLSALAARLCSESQSAACTSSLSSLLAFWVALHRPEDGADPALHRFEDVVDPRAMAFARTERFIWQSVFGI